MLAKPPAGYLLDAKAFAKAAPPAKGAPVDVVYSPRKVVVPGPFRRQVLLYDSATTRRYLNAGGVNSEHRIEAWDSFLKRYRVPFKVVRDVAQIEHSAAAVLLLPSSIALSDEERQAIVEFRARGGSVLATWATGVRNERGHWVGFGFMKQALDTEVVGSTAGEKSDQFLMPQGDGPISHSLAAGYRIWSERVPEWYPLRLRSKNPAVHVMDWSRNFHDQRETTVAHFEERAFPGGAHSRVVALGLPERLLGSIDAKLFDAIIHDSLGWLLRLPRANTAAWPSGLDSALLFAINAVELFNEADVAFVRQLGEAGVHATIYALGDNAKRSSERLNLLTSRGHELAVMGDRFNGFRGQPLSQQRDRLDAAITKIREAGLNLPEHPGFHAPTESYDRNTETLIRGKGFGHYIALQDISESRTPIVISAAPGTSAGAAPIVAFPRSQRGPEDATEEGDVDDGLKSFYAELALSIRMRGLAVIRIPNQGLLPLENLSEVAAEIRKYRDRVWMATASELAAWWLERARLSSHVEGDVERPILTVTVTGSEPLRQAVTVLVHLPDAHSEVELLRDAEPETRFKTFRIDAYRAGVEFKSLAAGTHRWSLRFRPAGTVATAQTAQTAKTAATASRP